MLEVAGLEAGYGRHKVLRGVSMQVPAGHVVALLGGNGAGKTTTLSAIMGLIPVRGGTVSFETKAIQSQPTHRVFRHGVALVPQSIARHSKKPRRRRADRRRSAPGASALGRKPRRCTGDHRHREL